MAVAAITAEEGESAPPLFPSTTNTENVPFTFLHFFILLPPLDRILNSADVLCVYDVSGQWNV